MREEFAKLMPLLRTPRKLDRLVIQPSYRPGAFDSHAVDCPFPFRHEGAWWMTFVGWDGTGYQTGLARSDDLVAWTKQGIVFGRGPKGSVTEYNAAMTNVLRDNALFGSCSPKKAGGRFLGTYHAYPQPGYETGPAVIGLCRSDDLRRWETGDPVLRPGGPGEWDGGGLYKSWLVEHEKRYYLFYNAKNSPPAGGSWTEQTGVAFSDDLRHWEKYGGNPILPAGQAGSIDEVFASDPVVMRHEGAWIMFYYTLDRKGVARDTVAFSRDLLHWEKSNEVLIDVGPPGSVDSRYAHKPGIVAAGGVLYHFYCAVSPVDPSQAGPIAHGERRGISLATSVLI